MHWVPPVDAPAALYVFGGQAIMTLRTHARPRQNPRRAQPPDACMARDDAGTCARIAGADADVPSRAGCGSAA